MFLELHLTVPTFLSAKQEPSLNSYQFLCIPRHTSLPTLEHTSNRDFNPTAFSWATVISPLPFQLPPRTWPPLPIVQPPPPPLLQLLQPPLLLLLLSLNSFPILWSKFALITTTLATLVMYGFSFAPSLVGPPPHCSIPRLPPPSSQSRLKVKCLPALHYGRLPTLVAVVAYFTYLVPHCQVLRRTWTSRLPKALPICLRLPTLFINLIIINVASCANITFITILQSLTCLKPIPTFLTISNLPQFHLAIFLQLRQLRNWRRIFTSFLHLIPTVSLFFCWDVMVSVQAKRLWPLITTLPLPSAHCPHCNDACPITGEAAFACRSGRYFFGLLFSPSPIFLSILPAPSTFRSHLTCLIYHKLYHTEAIARTTQTDRPVVTLRGSYFRIDT